MCLDVRLRLELPSPRCPDGEERGTHLRPLWPLGRIATPCRVAPLSGASPSAHPVGTGKGKRQVARIFDVRGAHLAGLLVLAAMVIAAVPAFADPGATASGGASASSEVVVKRGDRGTAVRRIQQELRISADGIFGEQTERAVKRFQRRHNLVPDGIVGPLTRGALGLSPFSSRSVRRTSSVRLPAILTRIAACESGGNPRAISPGGQYRGKYE